VEFQRNTDQQLNLSNLSSVETVEDVEDVEVPERVMIGSCHQRVLVGILRGTERRIPQVRMRAPLTLRYKHASGTNVDGLVPTNALAFTETVSLGRKVGFP
jgi:hypothetical protein